MAKTQNQNSNDLNAHIDSIDLKALGAIDPADVMIEVQQFAGKYGWVSELHLQAVRVSAGTKAELDDLYTKLDLAFRQNAQISHEKITEKGVEAHIKQTAAWRTAKEAHDEASARADRCAAALKVLDKKGRMLELLAQFSIREYGHNLRTQ